MPRADRKAIVARHRLAALQLHRRGAGFLEDARGAEERLLGRGLIAAERHVDDDEAVPAAAHHGGAVRAHHLEADRHGRGQAVDHLPQQIADEQHVAMRIEQLRHPHGVGGQHHQRLGGDASFLRARIAGTVIRFIGAGVGLARLVAVSMVKVVDMSLPNRASRETKSASDQPRRSAVTSISTFISGLTSPTISAVAAGRISPNASPSTGPTSSQ